MRFDVGSTNSAGQITTAPDRVQVVEFHARSNNTGAVYVGRSDVSTINGRELPPGESYRLNFANGTVSFSDWHVAFEYAGDYIDWTVILP